MSTGFIWIAAILILGGVIATVGDRIGTKVGKARLSLFKLRPRKTATLVTILTGTVISASSLGILLAADNRLRAGLFEIGRIQEQLEDKRKELTNTRKQLDATNQQKIQVEKELAKALSEQKAQQVEAQKQQAAAQKRLAAINQSLRSVLINQIRTQSQLNRTRSQLSQVSSQYQQAQARLNTVSQQAKKLRQEIQQRQSELQKLVTQRNELQARITQRDREIVKLDQEIQQRNIALAERNRIIAQRETRLKALEKQREYLKLEVQLLERDLRVLRRGNFVIFRGQVLSARVVRIVNPSATRQAVDQLLREANRNTIELTQPGVSQVTERVVKISEAQVEKLIKQINDGRDYYVRIISANNYVVGEKTIQVLTEVDLNQLVFKEGYVLAAITADPSTMTSEEVNQRLELLLGASKFRAQRAGIIMPDTIEIANNRIQTLIRFFEQLQRYKQPVELQAIAAEDIYTAGPLQVELVAVQDGKVIFGTNIANEKLIVTPEPVVTPTPQRLLPRKPIPEIKKERNSNVESDDDLRF